MRSKTPNRLAQQTSPYLLQHAHNPVDWYPWGPEAFAKARAENKPIFLSVGYSTCYWCHVMERQSFENDEIAAEMNQLFVNIKVDREERPDVDQIYMTAVQMTTHHGGWPMSVWLTPELKPFYAGTYFPPQNAHGRPGFLTICRGIADAWENRRSQVMDAAEQLTSALRQLAKPQSPKKTFTIDDAWLERMIDRSTSDYDAENGGFGSAPKFPRETLLRLLLVHQRDFPDEGRMKMITHTLDALAAGGIRDHLGGGFHRYSTDAHWLVPHFEIMLYDNAMLAWIYAEAFAQAHADKYEQVARGILDFLLREMRSPEGAFYTAFDAETHAMEGESYLWTLDEVREIFGEADAEIFARAYGLNAGPNFADPHHGSGQPDKNVLYRAELGDSIAKSMQLETAEIDHRLAQMRGKLYEARRAREQPSLDTKILVSWNALTISALAHAGRVFKEDHYLQAAMTAANYLLASRAQNKNIFLDDDAFLAAALLDLAAATGNSLWQKQAGQIASEMPARFGESSAGGFYFTAAGADDLIVRQKIGGDSPLPAGNAIAASVFLQLGQSEISAATFREFAGQLQTHSEAMSAMLESVHRYLRTNPPIEIHPAAHLHTGTHSISPEDVLHVDAKWIAADHLLVQLRVHPDYHINSSETAGNLIPTQLFIRGAQVEKIIYPRAQSLQVAGETLAVYAGTLEIHVDLAQAPSDPRQIQLQLQYQPCTDTECLASVRKTIELAV